MPGLKRKRSASEFCSSSPSSACSTPSAFSFSSPPPPPSFGAMDTTSSGATPAHLPSRTMKRFRDGRPSDDEVHRKFYEWRAHHHQNSQSSSSCVPAERTLNLLFNAQQQQQQHQQQPMVDTVSSLPQNDFAQPSVSSATNRQQSLHRFWNINSAPSAIQSPPCTSMNASMGPSNCEDCGTGLGAGGNDYRGMDVDGYGLDVDHGCGACGKQVCFSCSVSNLGEQRRCLQCAGRKVWVGGIGWTDARVSVC